MKNQKIGQTYHGADFFGFLPVVALVFIFQSIIALARKIETAYKKLHTENKKDRVVDNLFYLICIGLVLLIIGLLKGIQLEFESIVSSWLHFMLVGGALVVFGIITIVVFERRSD